MSHFQFSVGRLARSLFVATLFFLISTGVVNAATYYIAPTGNDTTGNGSINSPWASLEKLSSVLVAGDTGYVRGGTYRSITPNDENKFKINGLNGTASNLIKIWAYPNEKPVFNLDNITPTQSGVGLYVSNSNYIHLKGLRVTGLKQCGASCSMAGMILFKVDNSIVELFEIDNIEGYGLYLQGQQNPGGDGSDNNLIKNVDVHHIGDRYSGWGGANGFNITGGDLSNNNVFEGCRIWWSSDDGFDFFGTNVYATIKNSWSFWNGYQPGTFQTAGDGYGFKLGPEGNNPPSNQLRRVLTNNLAFENRVGGFDQNSGTSNTMLYRLHNNTSYGNGQFSYFFGANTNMAHDFKNNIAVGGSINGSEILSGPNVQTNSWNGNVIANSNDFVSVSARNNPNCLLATVTDTNCPNGPRQADGSLPDMNFLKLVSTSDLINAGTNVGLPYTGSAPDIGAFEYSSSTPPPTNTPPTASAGADQTITLPTNSVTLTGSGSDAGGSISAYAWTKVSGTGGTITSPTTATTTITGLTQGTYVFRLTVTDNGGLTASDDVNVVVNAPVSTKFTLGDRVYVSSGPLNVRATASTSGSLLGTQSTNALGTITGGPTAGNGYTWWNVNYDNAPDGWSVETYLEKYVAPPQDTTPPTTTLTAPTNNQTLSGTTTLSATATDAVGVTKVEFYRGTTLLGSDTTSPYTYLWNTTTTANGAYQLSTKAYDAAGNTGTSSVVNVTVNNTTTPPPVGTVINTSLVTADSGYAYQYINTFGNALADNASNMTQSTLKLFENGVEIGPAHASHYDVQTLGQGRFSHWGENSGTKILLFSASDNSNPRTNGRVYTYTINQ